MWAATYSSYGNLAIQHETDVQLDIQQPLRFQGQYHDVETGLHYNRHRYYDPHTGSFITQDPIKLLGGINNYQYVPNPVGWVDPLGLTAQKESSSRQFNSIGNTQDQLLLPAPQKLTPEMPGQPIVSDMLPVGYRFKQAVSPGQNTHGKFGTTDDIPDVNYVRNDLAVIPSFKPVVSGYREVEVVRPVRAQTSVVGPQTENGVLYPGGGSQVDVLWYDPYDRYVKFVTPETPLK